MLNLLWLIPLFPIVGFLILAIFGSRMSRAAIAVTGVGSIALSALVSILVTASFLISTPAGGVYEQYLWSWISVGALRPQMGLYLDALSLIMTLVVTFVSFLIHWYSAE